MGGYIQACMQVDDLHNKTFQVQRNKIKFLCAGLIEVLTMFSFLETNKSNQVNNI